MTKTAVVTGANVGIGFQTALALAKSGIHVVLACRNQGRALGAMSQIVLQVPQASVEYAILDLSSLGSVKDFASRVKQKFEKIDLLVNNAAVMALPERTLSTEGYEMQFATNHLGHFALTIELMPLLLKSSAARVVTVSSIAHRYGKLDFADLQAEKSYEGWTAYGTSKLANLLFSFELARRASAAALPLMSVACHPGVSQTNILASGPQMGRKVLRTYISEIFARYFAQSAEQGALPVIHACMDEEVKNGDYYGPDGFMELSGMPKRVDAKPLARDEDLARKLWSVSESLTGTCF